MNISRLAIVLVIAFMTSTIYSCKKETPAPTPSPTSSTDIASKIIGNYVGSGESASGTTFVNQTIKVSKINNTKVRVEPVGHSYISAFDVEVIEIMTAIVEHPDEDPSFSVEMSQSPYAIAFETSSDASFGGFKQ